MTAQWIVFQDERYILVEDGAIATEEQYVHGWCSYAHMYADGTIKRHGEVIGTRADITILGPANDVEIDVGEALANFLTGYGWPWDGWLDDEQL